MATGLAETDASPAIQLNTLALAVLAYDPAEPSLQIFTFMLLPASLALLSRDAIGGARRCWLMIRYWQCGPICTAVLSSELATLLSLHQRGWIAGFWRQVGPRGARFGSALIHTSRERWQL